MDAGPLQSSVLRLSVLFIIIIIGFVITLARISFVSANDVKIEKMADKGKKGAIRIVKLSDKKAGIVLSSMKQAGIVAGFFFVAFGNIGFAYRLADSFELLFQAQRQYYDFLVLVSTIVLTTVLCFLYVTFCDILPKKIAMQNPEKTGVQFSLIVSVVSIVFRPFAWLCRGVANAFIAIFGLDPKADEEKVTEEEIRMLVDAGEEKGVLEDTQREMINNIFEFDDIIAGDIMTHRTDIDAVSIDSDIQEVVELSIKAGCSRIPVFKEDLDNIIGIINVKDLLKFVGTKLTQSEKLKQLVRPAFFVPETMACGKLFEQMTENRIQLAIIIDEYGGTAGLVTIEDLLESIVGNIQDEYDDEDEEITKIDESTYTFDGSTDIEEFCEIADISVDDLPEGEFDTLAGCVIALLGYVPEDNQTPVIEYKNIVFTVLSVDEKRIEKIKIEIKDYKESESVE